MESIGISDGQTNTILPYDEESNLEAILLQLEHLTGHGALLVCRGETELRQVLEQIISLVFLCLLSLFLLFSFSLSLLLSLSILTSHFNIDKLLLP